VELDVTKLLPRKELRTFSQDERDVFLSNYRLAAADEDRRRIVESESMTDPM
jgi:hypothetical protein